MEISMRVWNFLIVIMATPNNLLNLANVAVRFSNNRNRMQDDHSRTVI